MITLRKKTAALALLVSSLTLPSLHAQDNTQVDVGQMLKELRTFREQTLAAEKANRTKALAEVNAAAASADGAVNAWVKAVMATQFEGLAKEGDAFKNWKEGDGEALKEPATRNAARLYFVWLSLTMQRASGTPVKELLPAVINFTKELTNEQALLDAHAEELRKDREKEARQHNNNPGQNQRRFGGADGNDPVKRMSDQMLKQPLSGSIVVQWLKIGDWVTVENWEGTPANSDGIFENIVLPELRVQKDQRAVEYWDMKIKRETERAGQAKLDFERDRIVNQRIPALYWKKAVEYGNVGMRNRAAQDMFALIRKYPTHPDADNWMAELEKMLQPAAPAGSPAATSTSTAPAAAPAPAAVAPVR